MQRSTQQLLIACLRFLFTELVNQWFELLLDFFGHLVVPTKHVAHVWQGLAEIVCHHCVGDSVLSKGCPECGKKGDIFHFYGKINGLATGPQFGKILHGIVFDFGITVLKQPKGKITATYYYPDANGKLLFQVCRIEPGKNGKKKDFIQRRPGARGKWTYNLKGIEH